MKLLLAEDEKRMASALVGLLRLEKYDVDHVEDGDSALAHLETNVYDGAIIDVMMPKRNGFDVVRTAREHNVTTPILMLTARNQRRQQGNPGLRRHGLRSGGLRLRLLNCRCKTLERICAKGLQGERGNPFSTVQQLIVLKVSQKQPAEEPLRRFLFIHVLTFAPFSASGVEQIQQRRLKNGKR